MLMKKILVGLALTATLSSCEKWFDVRPSSIALATQHFERESGFNEQLIGVYTKMASSSLYGVNMSFGFAEVLSQNYDLNSGNIYYPTAQYQYNNADVKSKIETIWTNSYNAIANLNVMLEHFDKVSPTIFSGDNFSIYQAEALGLRAFLHFDLLRLFGTSTAAGGANIAGIPYVSTYSNAITPMSTNAEVISKVKTDLLKALELYGNIDSNNQNRFNRYAVLATLARVYQWEGDLDKAKATVEELLQKDDLFYWVHHTTMESQHEYEWDKVFSTEAIFRLSIKDLDDVVNEYFATSAKASQLLNISTTKMDQIFEVTSKGYGGDYRFRNNYQFFGSTQYFSKFYQFENSRYKDLLPLIRLGEMYLILAEAELKTDKEAAVERLNTIREHRGTLGNTPLEAANMTEAQVQDEIYKEYRKETIGEGQLFYYYKRLNKENIPGAAVNPRSIYKLPLPDNEIEFGNR